VKDDGERPQQTGHADRISSAFAQVIAAPANRSFWSVLSLQRSSAVKQKDLTPCAGSACAPPAQTVQPHQSQLSLWDCPESCPELCQRVEGL